jgi:hypothetical protein
VSRRPIGPQAVAVLASLSVNALLLLGLRQVGSLSPGATAADDVVPLLVFELASRDSRAQARSNRRPRAPSRAGVGRTSPRHRQPAAAATAPAIAPDAGRTPSLRAVEVEDDRWQAPRRDAGQQTTFPTAFQRSLADPAPGIERPSVLAGVAFRDGSFTGLLAGFARMADCGELHAAMAHHPESAATIARTMERRGCRR